MLALAVPLGRVLSDVVRDLLGRRRRSRARPVLLVPVPSRRAVVRRRGHDPLLRTAGGPPYSLRRTGVPATVRPLLVPAGRVLDQSTLDAACPGREPRRVDGRPAAAGGRPGRRLVVVDDVLTTGSTVREAQRALEEAGLTGRRGRHGGRDPAPRGRGPGVRNRGAPYRSWGARTNVCVWSPSGSVVASAEFCARTGPVSRTGAPTRPAPCRQADASRRRSGPRKTSRPTVAARTVDHGAA